MNYNSDDEDGTESSIYDLDSAPPLPSGHNAHLHPDSSGPSSPNRRPRWSSSAPNMHNAAPARRRAHTSSVLPRRPSFASATSPTTTRSPSPVIKLPSAQSFPPPHSSKAANGKQVAFANSRDSDDAMLNIPEIDDDDDLLDEDAIIDEVDKANARKQQYRDTHSSVDYSQSSAATADDSTTSSRNKYVSICGYPVPTCWCIQEFSWNRIAIAVVNKAPCFGCTSMLHHTYRSVLVRLNILCAFFATGQVVSTVWFYIIMQSPLSSVDRDVANQTELETRRRQNEFEVLTNVWNINGSVWFLGVLALIVLVSIGLTIRVIRNVNLVGVVRFLWVILWVLPLQAAMVVGLFDYFHVTQVWIKYWWRDRTMAWFRHRFCEPREFANTLCAVPIYGSEDEERVRTTARRRRTTHGFVLNDRSGVWTTTMLPIAQRYATKPRMVHGCSFFRFIMEMRHGLFVLLCWYVPVELAPFVAFAHRNPVVFGGKNAGEHNFSPTCAKSEGIERTCLAISSHCLLWNLRSPVCFQFIKWPQHSFSIWGPIRSLLDWTLVHGSRW